MQPHAEYLQEMKLSKMITDSAEQVVLKVT